MIKTILIDDDYLQIFKIERNKIVNDEKEIILKYDRRAWGKTCELD